MQEKLCNKLSWYKCDYVYGSIGRLITLTEAVIRVWCAVAAVVLISLQQSEKSQFVFQPSTHFFRQLNDDSKESWRYKAGLKKVSKSHPAVQSPFV